ncbi:hypothetical protein [Nannocystis radixulma]|uniref:Uncharacterized protein n=1 Tax=Nannocystis radixulma TaxID=2995305 RepID=A0ABT5BBW5_9BACT|nr:hypothetical protein [Nannocystis radixulma]MDC0671621.1 hypothetical protein [Nannocystis radixulma]
MIKDSVPYRTAEYAAYQIPIAWTARTRRKALQAVGDDPAQLGELIAAYGLVRPGDAAGAAAPTTSTPRSRGSARPRARAFLAYVTGTGAASRAQAAALRRRRAAGESAAQLTYARPGRIRDHEPDRLPPPDLAEPDRRTAPKDSVFAGVCEAQPERLARAYFAAIDDGRGARERAEIAAALAEPDRAAAIATLDRLLADDPSSAPAPSWCRPTSRPPPRRSPPVTWRSGRLWRKSAALLDDADPTRADALRVQALLAEADLAATEDGRRMLLATAAELAPDDAELQARLSASAERTETATSAIRTRLAYGAGLAVGGLSLLLGLGGLFHRTRARS